MSIIAAAACIGASVWMIKSSKEARDTAMSEAQALTSQAQAVVTRAAEAETMAATAGDLVRNIELSRAMMQHNVKVTNFYRSMQRYIPSFYRLTSINYSQDADGGGVTLNLSGTLKTEQQYTDLMLALLRIPGAQAVSRSGFTRNGQVLPNVTEQNPNPKLILENETPLPDEGYDRMNALVARASQAPTGFQNVGNFGGPETSTRGAMPEWATVNVSVVLKTPAPVAPVPPTGGANPPGPNTAPNPGGGQQAAPPAGAPGVAVEVPVISYDLRVPDPMATLGVAAMSGGGGFSGGAGGGGGRAGGGAPPLPGVPGGGGGAAAAGKRALGI